MSNRCKALVLSLILAAAYLPLAAQTYTLQAFSLPYAPQSDTYATGINNRGAVVGYFLAPKQHIRGFKRNAAGVFEPPIDDPNAVSAINPRTYALGINDSGVIVGYYVHPTRGYMGFLRDNGVFTDFSTGPGNDTFINGINNKGDFVGQALDSSGTHAFVDSGGVLSLFDVPGGAVPSANGIAADGTIVGHFGKNAKDFGFVRGPAGRFNAFQIPGAIATQAFAVNNLAHKIVGSYFTYPPRQHGFVYDYTTGVTTTVDWPDPNTSDTVITGVNSHGVVVGYAVTNTRFSFIGTPVP